jgi:hypothetical protein
VTDPSDVPPRTPPAEPPAASGEPADPQPDQTVREMFREALLEHRASIRQNVEEGKPPPIFELLGGKLGMVESVLPVAVFSLVYGVTRDLRTAIIAALVPSVLTTTYRLIRRETLMSALSGLFGVGIGALVAWWTGGASGFFIPGALKNVIFAVAIAVSIAVRWPVVGVFLGFLLGEDTAWREVDARRKAYVFATWVWFGMFAIRAAIQIPLLLADEAVKLGVVNIVLGLPLYACVLLLTWLIVRRVPVVRLAADPDSEADSDSEADPDSEPEPDPGVDPDSAAAPDSGGNDSQGNNSAGIDDRREHAQPVEQPAVKD